MSTLLHVCLYNTEPDASKEIQTHITGLNFVRYVGEVSSFEDLSRTLISSEVNVVFFHLDPNPNAFIEVIDQVSTRYPNVALIGLSHKSDLNAVLGPMRAGCDQFVCEPIDSTDLANAVSRVATRRLARSTKSRCICVMGPSGGSGATSIATNLALEIGHLTDRECGLLDLDLQFGDAAMYFDVDPRYTVFDLADAGEHMDRTLLASCVTALPCKVALLSRPDLVEQAESVTPEAVHRILELMSSAYEHVVVDLPNKIDPSTLAVLQQADHVLIVAQLLVPSVRNARRCHDALLRYGLSEDRIDFVMNRVDAKSGRIAITDVEDSIKKPIFATVPNDYQFVAKSIDFGRPIAAMDSNSQVRVALRKMANKLIVTPPHMEKQNADRRGFLSRLLSSK